MEEHVITPDIKVNPQFRQGHLGLLDTQRFIKQHRANDLHNLTTADV